MRGSSGSFTGERVALVRSSRARVGLTGLAIAFLGVFLAFVGQWLGQRWISVLAIPVVAGGILIGWGVIASGWLAALRARLRGESPK